MPFGWRTPDPFSSGPCPHAETTDALARGDIASDEKRRTAADHLMQCSECAGRVCGHPRLQALFQQTL